MMCKEIRNLFLLKLILLLPLLALCDENAEKKELLSQLKNEKNDSIKVIIYANISNIYWYISPDSVEYYAKLGYELAEDIDYKVGKARCLNSIGVNHWILGDLTQALDCLMEALEIYENYKHDKEVSACLNNIGSIYLDMKELPKALLNFEKCIALDLKIGDTINIAQKYNNIGLVYYKKNEFENALIYFYKALKIAEKYDEKFGIGLCLTNISDVYYKQDRIDSALIFNEKALAVTREINDIEGEAFSLLGLSKIYNKLGNKSKALQYGLESFEIANKNSLLKSMVDGANHLSIIYENTNDYKNAFKYFKLASEAKDSIFSEAKNKEINNIQHRYEINKKNKEIELIAAKEKKRRLQLTITIVGSMLLLILIFVFIYLHRKIKKANGMLSNQKNEIMQQRDNLKILNEKLNQQKEYIANQHDLIKEELTETLVKSEILKRENIQFQYEQLKNQVNPHFLFNNFSTLANLIAENPQQAEKYVLELSNVYRYILTSSDQLQLLKSEINFINSYLFLIRIRFDDNIVVNIRENILHKEAYVPLLSLQLLVENAIKHNVVSSKKPLTIDIFEENEYLVVKNILQKKFSVENSTKVGLQNIVNRYKLITERPVIIEQNETEFIVKLPLIV